MHPRIKNWETSYHFEIRRKERDMPHPKDLGLRVAKKKKQIDLIKESCKKNGFKKTDNFIYWIQIIEKELLVYVTVIKGINHYKLITCFKYKNVRTF